MAVRSETALDQSLRTVLERVGEWIAAHIADRQTLALLFENEVNAPLEMGDRTGADVAGNTHTLVKSGALQGAELGYRVVVALALCVTGVGQRYKRCNDDSRPDQKLRASLHAYAPIPGALQPTGNSSTMAESRRTCIGRISWCKLRRTGGGVT